jgi:hypothetical protein
MVLRSRGVNGGPASSVASTSSATAVGTKRPAAGTPPLQFLYYATMSGTTESGAWCMMCMTRRKPSALVVMQERESG